ncbi:hypothetical protein [Nocardia sp. alder85J]|uniref:hypothetical protein n=1 Tax=Nocardia sp. alder85J TaxID=2862949 RepID=UPI001CD1FD16|nr:hypothetical protein [Nocardia sp. alder85J]MCX4093499.1 hypothetical protein [Nocardia sp. alder85J]
MSREHAVLPYPVAAGGAAVLIAAVELIALRGHRGLAPVLAAVPLTATLALLIRSLTVRRPAAGAPEDTEIENGPAEMLRRWHARAQMLADRADGSRADWDRHLRPLLAKEFELSTGHRLAKDRRATAAVGRMQFGPELWQWVDPENTRPRAQDERAPGRAALDEILRRLQEM